MQQKYRSHICRTVGYAALLLSISECNTAPSADGTTARETQRIIGGQDATGSNQFPGTMAAIAIAWPDSTGAIAYNSIQCGGTLIDPWFVLTAAHCFTQEVGLGMPDYSNYRIVLSNTTYYTPKTTDIKIAGVFRHPLFRSVPGHDIALVRLSHPVSQTLTKLPTVSPPTGLAVGSPLSIFGWGGLSTDPNQQTYPANLQQANVAYYGEGDTCKQYEDLTTDPSNSLANIGATEICIGRVAGVNQPKSTCGGDSGGPAMFNDGTNNVQVGVVSHGTPYGVCGGTMPDVFTSVADHLDFINTTIAGNRADLDGDGTKDTTVYLAEGLSNLQLYLTFDAGKIPANLTQSLGPIDTGIPVLYARDQGVDYRTAMHISPQDSDASDDVLVNVGGLKAFFAGSELYTITAKILTLNGFPSADKNDGRFGALATRGLATVDRPYATFYIVQPAPGAPFQVDVFDADNVGYWDKPLDGVKTCVRLFADPNTNGGEDDVDSNGNPLSPIVSTSFGPTPPFDTGWVQLSGGNITPASDAFNGTSWGYRLEIYLAPVTPPSGTTDSCDLGPTAQTIPDGVINGYKVATDAQLKLSDVDFGFMAVDSTGDYTPNPPDPYIQSKDTNYYGFFTFPFYVGNSTYQGTFTNADADDPDHPSPSLAIGANRAINFRIYAFKQHAHGFYPASEFPNETAIGRPSGGYNPNQGYVEGDQETITDLPMNPFGNGSTASHDAAYGAWLWDKVMDSNIVHLWVPRGSPQHLEYMLGGSSYVPTSAALPPTTWRTNAGLSSRLPVVLGVPGAQVITVSTVSQAQSILSAAIKVDGAVSSVANRLQGGLLAAKLNRKLAQERGEDLGGGQIYGTSTSVASVLDYADTLVGQGASADTSAMDQVSGQLGSINAGQVTYTALPINDSGDKDPDGDGVIANLDNCPAVANSNQLDSDKNGIGDACEPTPYVRCIVKRSTDYLAYFGYTNQYADRRIAVGNNNRMSPGAINRGQPALQHLGDYPYAVTVPFTSSVTWSLAGHSATANTLSPPCAGSDVTHVNFGQNVVLYASGDLKIDDRVKLVGWTTAANAGTGTTDIGASANVGNVMSVANVTVRSSATVNGLLQSSGTITPQAGANLLGGSQAHATLSVPPLAWSVTFPAPTGGDVTLNSGDPARPLAPGSYRNVQLNGNGPLKLTAGTYYMTSLQINSGGIIQLDQSLGAIIIYVQSALGYQGSFVVIGGGQPNLLLGYFGTSTAYLQAPLSAAVVAPNATVVLGGQGSGQYSGSFFAKNLEANAGTTFQFLAVGP